MSCAGMNDGPVKIKSNENIVAAERVVYRVSGVPTSFSELMALPEIQVRYYLLDAVVQQRRLGYPTEVRECEWFDSHCACVPWWTGNGDWHPDWQSLHACFRGASLRVSFKNSAMVPEEIVSDQNIVAAERVIQIINNNTIPISFSEMMGLSKRPPGYYLLAALVQQY